MSLERLLRRKLSDRRIKKRENWQLKIKLWRNNKLEMNKRSGKYRKLKILELREVRDRSKRSTKISLKKRLKIDHLI